MMSVAFKMLIGNRASLIGAIFGVFLAILLISQQSGIFLGLVSRSYRMVSDIPTPNVWVIDPATRGEDTTRRMPEGYLDIVRSVPGVEWAVPIRLIEVPIATDSGNFKVAQLYGIDDATMIGAPLEMVSGNQQDLHREGGVIIDVDSANNILAKVDKEGNKIPLKVGDTFEINNHRAVIVGISRITPGFFPQPIIFTSNSQFEYFSPYASDKISFIAAKTNPDANVDQVLKDINQYPFLRALTSDGFKNRIANHFLKTGILINFGLSVLLGIIIGFSITGQIFYNLTQQNLNYYAVMKAIGGTQKSIVQMIALQIFLVGIIGYILGTGATFLWGLAIKNTTLAFLFPWQLFLFTLLIALIICAFSIALSVRKILNLDPKILMGN